MIEPTIARPARDPRRRGLGAAAIIAGYACAVGLISANAGAGELGPPDLVPRPALIAALLMVPAAIAAIGALRRSPPLLAAAGFLCLPQAFLAFSGVTLPFIVPGFLLIALGVYGCQTRQPRRAVIGAAIVVILGIGALASPFALTEPICWVARAGPDGELIYRRISVSDTLTVGLDEVASGCDGGATTAQGIALAAILAIGAILLAELSSRPTPATPPASASGRPGRPSRAQATPSRRWAIGLVVGAVFGAGVLIFGTLAAPLGLAAVALLAWEPGRAAPVGGFLAGFGTTWLLLFVRADLSCAVDCVSPNLIPWYAAGIVSVAAGAILSLYALRHSKVGTVR